MSNRYYSQKQIQTHILGPMSQMYQKKQLNYVKITRYSQRSHMEKWLDIHKRFQVGKYSQIVYIRKQNW